MYLENFCSRILRFWVTAVEDNLEIEKLMGGRRKESEWKAESNRKDVRAVLEEDLGCLPASESALERGLRCA